MSIKRIDTTILKNLGTNNKVDSSLYMWLDMGVCLPNKLPTLEKGWVENMVHHFGGNKNATSSFRRRNRLLISWSFCKVVNFDVGCH